MKNLLVIPELVINWHLTEACNYRCHYCYAAWAKPDRKKELIHDSQNTTKFLLDLYDFFRPENNLNPLTRQVRWKRVRLNIAGGEPTLYADKLVRVVSEARSIGFTVSMITNASRLNDRLLNILAPNMSWLGISTDSLDLSTNKSIGRFDQKGNYLNIGELSKNITVVRQQYPGLGLKLNTVINKQNWMEDMSSLLDAFAPDKWKVLRVLPVVNNDLSITDAQFQDFVQRHKKYEELSYIEDNNDMRDSYIMVDPHGRFFQNSSTSVGSGYFYSRSINSVGTSAAFTEIGFLIDKFLGRYSLLNGAISI